MTAGGKLFLTGVIVALAGAGGAISSGALQPRVRSLAPTFPVLVLAAGAVLVVSGAVVYVAQPVFSKSAAARMPAATVRTSLAMFFVAVVVANMLSLPLALNRGASGLAAAGQPLGPVGLTYLIAASELPLLGVVWFRLVLPGGLSWRGLGLTVRDFSSELRAGLAGGLVLFATAGLVGAALTALGVKQNQYQRFEGIQGASPPLFAAALLAGCVLAPLSEELFFRGYVFQTFRRRYGGWWAYLFSAGLFAAVHANVAAAAPIFVLGLILAAIFQRSGSLVPGIIAHGVNNAIAFLLLYGGVTN